jgi:hypothetical protein
MSRDLLSTTHLWFEQQVSNNGRTFLHRQCKVCSRDFALASDEGEWRAVHVGLLKFDFLDDEITKRWISEDCPGCILPGEENDERMPARR